MKRNTNNDQLIINNSYPGIPCRAAKPSFLVRAMARWPGAFSLIALLAFGLSVPVILSPPGLDTSFESLTIKDHPVVLNSNGRLALSEYASAYWKEADAAHLAAAQAAAGRRLLASEEASSHSTASSPHAAEHSAISGLLPHTKRTLSAAEGARSAAEHSAISGRRLHGDMPVVDDTRRMLEQLSVDGLPVRGYVDHTLHVVYRRPDGASTLTEDTIAAIKNVEDTVFRLPRYQQLCVHNPLEATDRVRVCRRPISFTNYAYGSFDSVSGFVPDGQCALPNTTALCHWSVMLFNHAVVNHAVGQSPPCQALDLIKSSINNQGLCWG